MAGGENLFNDIDKNWVKVSWEEVVDRKPEVIVIVDYGEVTVQQKIDFLLNKSSLAGVPAIQNQRFVILPLSAAAEGVRAPIALDILARGFYPEKFE
jgi:iron complex transport system substrate-binding protein